MARIRKKPPLSGSTLLKDVGEAAAATTTRNREYFLRTALRSGRIRPDQLGPGDRASLHLDTTHASAAGGGGGGGLSLGPLHVGGPIGESIGNFFGGVEKFATGLPVGLFTLGKSVIHDVGNPALYGKKAPSAGESDIVKNIIQPTAKSYAHKYSGSLGDILHKTLVEDPFGTLLDVGTVASLGSGAAVRGGSLVGKVGRGLEAVGAEKAGGTLRNVGRSAINFGLPKERPAFIRPEPGTPSIPRGRYSPGLFMRAGQKATDVLLGTGKGGILRNAPVFGKNVPGSGRFLPLGDTLGETYGNYLHRKWGTTEPLGAQRLQEAATVGHEMRPIVKELRHADPEEIIAVALAKRGITPQRIAERGGISFIDAYKQNLERSLRGENPPGFNIGDIQIQKAGVEGTAHVEYLVNELSKPAAESRVVELLNNPTPKMEKISELYDHQAEINMQTLGITPEEHRQRIWQSQEVLRTDPTTREIAADEAKTSEINSFLDPEGDWEKFSQQYAQHTGRESYPIRPNYIPDEVAQGAFRTDRKGLPKFKQKTFSRRHQDADIAKQLTRPGVPSFFRDTDMRLFLAGAIRMDGKEMLNLVKEREKFLTKGGGMDEWLARSAAKDENGEMVLVNADDFENGPFDPQTQRRAPVEGFAKIFEAETDHLAQVSKVVDRIVTEQIASHEGNLPNLQASLNALTETEAKIAVDKTLAAATPKMPVVNKSDWNYLMETLAAQQPKGWMSWVMNKWRNQILFWMPRWYVNTAVGSMVLSAIHGSLWNPKALIAAGRHARGDRLNKLMHAIPGSHPGVMGAEVAEQIGSDVGKNILETKVAQRGARTAEGIEGFFKKTAIFHTMNKEKRLALKQMDEAIEPYQRGFMRDEYIDELLKDPELVRSATNNMNEFFYNYTILGAFERRYVRQFIPFFGWYKFATKFVWRLPFAYPGRANIIDKLGDAGRSIGEDELGVLPPWVKGSIFLNTNRDSLDYIQTLGINPMGSFANPLGPRGPILGAIEPTQTAPEIQGLLSAGGIDPLKGSAVELSPQDQFATGLFGTPYNLQTGTQTPGGFLSASGLSRFLGGAARSFPVARILEDVNTQGRGTYPESIPNPYIPGIGGLNLGTERPLPAPAEHGSEFTTSILRSIFGGGTIPKKGYSLTNYQDWLAKDLAIARGKRASALKRLQASGVK